MATSREGASAQTGRESDPPRLAAWHHRQTRIGVRLNPPSSPHPLRACLHGQSKVTVLLSAANQALIASAKVKPVVASYLADAILVMAAHNDENNLRKGLGNER